MPRADLLLSLVRAGMHSDHPQFRRTVEAIAAEERAKNHTILADRLVAQLEENGHRRVYSKQLPNDLAGQFVYETAPRKRLEDLILCQPVQEAIEELVNEQNRADLLRSYNLEPRHRVILVGPPGNGKTSLAEATAYALAVSLLTVRYEAVIGSYLGETAQRISRLFDHARTMHCVLFFDEFDVVGKERGDTHDTGEIKRVVSSLLLLIDSLPSYVVVITASNHPELLDRAAWRRFQLRLELGPPRQGQIEEWFRRLERRTGHGLGLSTRSLAQRLKGLSFAEIEDFGLDIQRRVILSQPDADIRGITERSLAQLKRRFSMHGEVRDA